MEAIMGIKNRNTRKDHLNLVHLEEFALWKI